MRQMKNTVLELPWSCPNKSRLMGGSPGTLAPFQLSETFSLFRIVLIYFMSQTKNNNKNTIFILLSHLFLDPEDYYSACPPHTHTHI